MKQIPYSCVNIFAVCKRIHMKGKLCLQLGLSVSQVSSDLLTYMQSCEMHRCKRLYHTVCTCNHFKGQLDGIDNKAMRKVFTKHKSRLDTIL